MKLRLIEGGAGSGKSRLCIAEMAGRMQEAPLGAPLLLITPEQATFQSERALAAFPGVGAALRAQVLSFSGLYRWLAKEAAYPRLPWLDEQGRAMLLLACVQDNPADLQLLKPSSKNVGLVELLARTLVEFEQYNITPAELSGAAATLPESEAVLIGKLKDLAVIYQAYLARVQGGFRDQGVMMQELKEAAAGSQRLNGAEIWLDGFMDMNPSQMAVVRQLMPKAATVTLTLNLPDLGAARIFGGQRQLRAQFVALAQELGAAVEVVRLTADHRHKDNPELAAIEVCFANGEFAAAKAEEPQHIHLSAAEDPRDEAELAARTIVRLCRDKGYKFRDIAVITRRINDYRLPLEAAFRDFAIPYFLDMGQEVALHPLVKLVAEVLAVLYDNWATPSVLAYLKSGLANIAPDEADILENYALRVGLRGTMWRQAGSFRRGRAEELPRINELAAEALRPLLNLQDKLKGAATVSEYAEGMLGFLTEVQAEEKMADSARQALAEGETLRAEAHRQIFAKVRQLLRELADFLGDMPADARRFAELWQEGAARLTLSTIPPSANQVSVADISRSRLPEVKAAIVLGLTEGVMPAVAEENGLLFSHDKEALARLGLKLPAGGRERQFLEDYLLYVALTRSSEELYLSYPERAADGTPKNPSPAVMDIQRVFPGLRAWQAPLIGLLGGDRALLKGLSAHLAALKRGDAAAAEDDAFWRGVCAVLQKQGRLGAELDLLSAGLAYQADATPLDSLRVSALYPNRERTSVSRLERFNNCPCQYYAQYGLALAPREEFKLETVQIGSLYHYIMAEVMAALVAADADWGSLTEADILPLIDEAIRRFAADGLADIFADSGHNSYAAEKIRAVVTRTLLDTAANLAEGSFRPVALEMAFGGGQGSDAAPLIIELKDGKKIRLVGQIDRIDAAHGMGGDFLRIIDYKMQNKTLRPADIYYGLNWQLPLYLQALLEGAPGSRPAGMFYVPVQEIVKSVKSAEESGAAVKLQGIAILDMEALTLAERDIAPGSYAKTMQVQIKKDLSFGGRTLGLTPPQYDFMQACLKREAAETLSAMLDGELAQRPVAKGGRTICEFCDYYALCALDVAVSPQVKEVEPISTAQVLEKFAGKYPGLAWQFARAIEEAK